MAASFAGLCKLKYCPECGTKLAEGVTRCWNPECSYELPHPNKLDDHLPPPKSEKLLELEMEYKLASQGLAKGYPASVLAMGSGFMSLLASGIVLVMTGKSLLSGNQLVTIFGILAAAIVIFFAFVFGRAARIKAQITKEKQHIEFEAGKKVR